MNKVVLLGRVTKDIELKTGGANNTSFARFTVAVNRNFKNADGNYEADFIGCLAFGKTAEFIAKYFSKGRMISLAGRIQTGNYTNKDGQKVYTTDVVVEEAHFADSKNDNNGGSQVKAAQSASAKPAASEDEFMNMPSGLDEELPFSYKGGHMYAFKVIATTITALTMGVLALFFPKMRDNSSRDVLIWIIGVYLLSVIAIWT